MFAINLLMCRAMAGFQTVGQISAVLKKGEED